MPIQEEVLLTIPVHRINDQRLDHPSLFDRVADGPVSPKISLRIFVLLHWQDVRQRQPQFAHLKTDLWLAHTFAFCFRPNFVDKYLGIVERASARSRFTKFSSSRILSKAVTTNSSFASQIFAFLISNLCRWLSRLYALTKLSTLVRL